MRNLRQYGRYLPINVVVCALIGAAAFATQADQTANNNPVQQEQTASTARMAEPTPYEAQYQARSHGMTTGAFRHLIRHPDQSYELSHGLSLSVLGATLISVTETSHFNWQDGGVQPLSYAFEQGGMRKRHRNVAFDWSLAQADIRSDRGEFQVELEPGVLDGLSFSAQISAELTSLANQSHPLNTGDLLSYRILDGRELETHEYRYLGHEQVDTPAGELETVHLQRVRESDSNRSTDIWLAEAYEFVLARLIQVEDGSRTELLLESIQQTP